MTVTIHISEGRTLQKGAIASRRTRVQRENVSDQDGPLELLWEMLSFYSMKPFKHFTYHVNVSSTLFKAFLENKNKA